MALAGFGAHAYRYNAAFRQRFAGDREGHDAMLTMQAGHLPYGLAATFYGIELSTLLRGFERYRVTEPWRPFFEIGSPFINERHLPYNFREVLGEAIYRQQEEDVREACREILVQNQEDPSAVKPQLMMTMTGNGMVGRLLWLLSNTQLLRTTLAQGMAVLAWDELWRLTDPSTSSGVEGLLRVDRWYDLYHALESEPAPEPRVVPGFSTLTVTPNFRLVPERMTVPWEQRALS